MRTITLFLLGMFLLTLATGCVSSASLAEKYRSNSPLYTRTTDDPRYDKIREKQQSDQWKEWDRNYVSDDVTIVHFYDEDGNYVGRAEAK